jgi:malonyl-CoA O-methyltransferase
MGFDRRLGRALERAAGTYDDTSALPREIATRLHEQLDWLKLVPESIVDAGCGTGQDATLLRARYPKARLVALDGSPAMLSQARVLHPSRGNMWDRMRGMFGMSRQGQACINWLCADIQAMPLASGSQDMVWSNLVLHWAADLPAAFREMRRVLRAGGLAHFSMYGPDTLKELRAASLALDGYAHVNDFIDMHDVGDMLVQAGFMNPVMSMECVTLTYDQPQDALIDLRRLGENVVRHAYRQGLMGRETWRRLLNNYELQRQEGRIPATFEIVYGHAWAGSQAQVDAHRKVMPIKLMRKSG